MECPVCSVSLEHVEYENVPLRQCPECEGYLVRRNRLLLIKRSRERSQDELQQEAAEAGPADRREPVQCPRCRVRRMKKERIPVEDGEDFHIDTCPDCEVVWFDGTELARLQLNFEKSRQAAEMFAMQQQARSRTPEDESRLRERLRELPSSGGIVGPTVRSGMWWAAVMLVFLTAVFLYFGYTAPSALMSLLAAFFLGALVIDGFEQRRFRVLGVTGVAVAEIAFLACVYLLI